MPALFNLGTLVATPGAMDALAEANTLGIELIRRHMTGDWGILDEHDRLANDRAVKEGTRILSAYVLSTGTKLYIITEADRASTTILLPSEY